MPHISQDFKNMVKANEEKKWMNARLREIELGMFSNSKYKFKGWEGPCSFHFRGPVHKLVNLVMLQAIKERASDMYFELSENEFMVKYVVRGGLCEMTPPPRDLYKKFAEDLEARFGVWGVGKKKEGFNRGEIEEEVIRLRKFDSGDFISATTEVKGKKINLNLMKIASTYGDVYHLALRAN